MKVRTVFSCSALGPVPGRFGPFGHLCWCSLCMEGGSRKKMPRLLWICCVGACLFLAAVWWITNAVVWKSTQLCGLRVWVHLILSGTWPRSGQVTPQRLTRAMATLKLPQVAGKIHLLVVGLKFLFSYWLSLWATLDSFSSFLYFLPPVFLRHSSLLRSLQQNLLFYLLRMNFKSHNVVLGVTLQPLCCSCVTQSWEKH